MKKSIIIICSCMLLSVAGLFAFNTKAVSSITGKVVPADGAEMVWALSGKDTIKVNPVMGAFTLQVPPGNYSIVVDAKAPYKDAQVDNVQVTVEQTVDVGEIILKQ